MLNITRLLAHAPAWLRRLAQRTASGQGVLGRVADTIRFRLSEDKAPALPPVSDSPVRLLIGPANFAGQGYQWARAAERSFPEVAAVSMLGLDPGVFRPDVDLSVPIAVYLRSSSWHSDFEQYLARQTHVIWEAGRPLLGRRYGGDIVREISQLEARGVQVALLFHGSDIRPPARHAAQSKWSPFHASTAEVRVLEERATRSAALASEAGVSSFVSTPDLLQWLPEATWCPVVVDSARWQEAASTAAETRSSNGVPVVAHAPSRPWLKGTDRIEPMLRRLAEEGVIEYRQIVGIPHAAMPAFYADADIMLDQFVLGIYGVAACEAMASGRLVMSHVDEFTRSQVRERTGLELPILEATVESLESELRKAAADPSALEEFRAAGPAFVDAVHDGRRSAAALAPFLGRAS